MPVLATSIRPRPLRQYAAIDRFTTDLDRNAVNEFLYLMLHGFRHRVADEVANDAEERSYRQALQFRDFRMKCVAQIGDPTRFVRRSEENTSELQSRFG